LEVLDAIRALDVLAARPEVDPERIGFTGESGGSNTTYWIAAVDPRVKLAVPVSSVTTFDYWIRTDRNWDWHQRPPGIRRIADIGTLLALHAPHPLLIISSRRGTDDEEFPLDEAEKSFQWAKHVYRLLAAEDAAAHYESTTAHGYQEDKRAQLYRAVERWLHPPFAKGEKELPAKVESFEDLRCGLPEENLTFRAIYAEWLKPLPRLDTPSDPAAQRAFLRARLGWPRPLPGVKAEKVAHEEKGEWSAEFWILESEPGIRLPAVRIRKKGATSPIVLVPGRDPQAVARALEAGQQVLALDLRATGELRHGEGGGTWPWLAGPPWSELLAEPGRSMSNWAWFAGRPWTGMWALDLRQAARFSREKLAAPSVAIDAENAYGWPALLAAAADPALITSGRVQLPWASLHDVVRARGDDALADVPGLLERLDIPQLRTLWPAGQVSVKGEAVAPAATATSGGPFYVAPDGRPENDGSLTRPWPSIEVAFSRAGAGSTIIVKPGVYRGTIQLRNLSGATAGRPTVIRSEVKWKAVIIGGESEALNVVNCPGIVIDGFEVLGARADGISMNTDFGTVRNCWVHNNGSMGISSHHHTNVTIANNLIEFNGSHVHFHHGVYASGDHLTVRGNIVRHNSAYGLHLYPSLRNSTVVNNLVHGHTRQSGVIVACPEGGGRNLIANNTIAFNAEGIAIWRGSGERTVNNIVAANTGAPLRLDHETKDVAVEYNLFDVAPRVTRAHNRTADPRFVDAARGVFWLRADSPAIAKGAAQYAPRTDFWGRPLPAGRPPDIGAFTYVPALAGERARAGWWQGWPYRFAAKAEMDVPDLWALPEGVR
jgi:hypothetical protein